MNDNLVNKVAQAALLMGTWAGNGDIVGGQGIVELAEMTTAVENGKPASELKKIWQAFIETELDGESFEMVKFNIDGLKAKDIFNFVSTYSKYWTEATQKKLIHDSRVAEALFEYLEVPAWICSGQSTRQWVEVQEEFAAGIQEMKDILDGKDSDDEIETDEIPEAIEIDGNPETVEEAKEDEEKEDDKEAEVSGNKAIAAKLRKLADLLDPPDAEEEKPEDAGEEEKEEVEESSGGRCPKCGATMDHDPHTGNNRCNKCNYWERGDVGQQGPYRI